MTRKKKQQDDDAAETTYSGKAGERERNTPGRDWRALGVDAEAARAYELVGDTPERTGDADPTGADLPRGERKNPPLVPDAGMGDGGISASGGVAGGARGNAGTSDSGAGGPEGDTKGGPAQHRGTSRFDLDNDES
jgi:hypothetical protein